MSCRRGVEDEMEEVIEKLKPLLVFQPLGLQDLQDRRTVMFPTFQVL